MGNRFRQAIGVILLLALGGIVALWLRAAGGTPGIGLMALQQALFLFGGIALVLLMFRRMRPKG